MSLTQVQIDHVRNLKQVRLRDLDRVNVCFGDNGSGKTSLLEALYLLGMARSFRSASIKPLITHGEASCTVFGELRQCDTAASSLSLGVQRNRDGVVRIRVGGQNVRSVAVLAEQLPLQVICADSFGLLTGPPGGRRQYLDWGVFHVEQQFFSHWQRFQRCIKQRNMLLRRGRISAQELAVWTRDLAQLGTTINHYRQTYFRQLTPVFEATLARLAPSLEGVTLRYRQGWDNRLDYLEALEEGAGADIEQGYTHSGPQRADIRVTTGSHLAAEVLSRGQQKLVICALKLAQGELLAAQGRRACTYLIDDLPSELDQEHGRRVCELLAGMEAQVFITCVEQGDIRSVWPGPGELALFHVEQGEIRREG